MPATPWVLAAILCTCALRHTTYPWIQCWEKNSNQSYLRSAEYWPFKDVHTLNPRTREDVTLPVKSDIGDVITVTDLKIEGLPWIIWVGLIESHGPLKAKNIQWLEGEECGRRKSQRDSKLETPCLLLWDIGTEKQRPYFYNHKELHPANNSNELGKRFFPQRPDRSPPGYHLDFSLLRPTTQKLLKPP